MASAGSPYEIPSTVTVSYQDAAAVLTAAKAKALAEFNNYLDDSNAPGREDFYKSTMDQATIDQHFPPWVDKLITQNILGIEHRENCFGSVVGNFPHRISPSSTETSGFKGPYVPSYYLTFAARGAVRKDATITDITAGLAGVTNIAKLCRGTLPDYPIALFQAGILTDDYGTLGRPSEDEIKSITLHSVMVIAKHILLERAQQEGWVLHEDLMKRVNDRHNLYMMRRSFIPTLPDGPAYRPATWMTAADPTTEQSEYTNLAPSQDDDGDDDVVAVVLYVFEIDGEDLELLQAGLDGA